MNELNTVVSRINGAVLAVDGDLRVLAMSPKAERLLGKYSSEIVGRPCYDIMSAIDTDTGATCQDHCPLASRSSQPGWAFSRMIKANLSGDDFSQLDCFLLKSGIANITEGNLCFLDQTSTSDGTAQLKSLQAIESIYPLVSSSAEISEVVPIALKAVLSATKAHTTELFLFDNNEGDSSYSISVLDTPNGASNGSPALAKGHLLKAMKASRIPLIATESWQITTARKQQGWYISVPLVGEGRIIGAVGVAIRQPLLDAASTLRTLFAVVTQLGLYLTRTMRQKHESATVSESKISEKEANFQFYCLGRFRAFIDGEQVHEERFRRLKAITLLRYLVAHRGGLVSREALLDMLWPSADPTRAPANLRVVLHDLRRGLEPDLQKGEPSSYIVSRDNLIGLTSSLTVWTDADEFVRRRNKVANLINRNRLEDASRECERALALYQGDYMEDEPYSDWCLFERGHLKEVYIDVLQRSASLLVSRGEVHEAITVYRKAIDADPSREDNQRQLMLALFKVNRLTDAIKQYEECRMTLHDQIGVEPSRETSELYAKILAGNQSFS